MWFAGNAAVIIMASASYMLELEKFGLASPFVLQTVES